MAVIAHLEEKLESEAEFGLFYANFKIGPNKADELRKKGFSVTDSKELKFYPRLHRICWKDAKVDECEDVYSLDEKSDEYNLAQKLWIIAMKNKPKKKQGTDC